MIDPRSLLAPLLLAALTAAPAPAQEPPPYAGEERITAVDVLVDTGSTRRLAPGRVDVLVDGRPRPVVAVEGPGRVPPWQVLVYLDAALADEHQVAWAAQLLDERLADLLRAGPVELVIADPEPRTVVSPTTDAEALRDGLAGALFFGSTADELVERRLEVLTALDEGAGAEEPPGPLAAALVAEETALVRNRLDTLLLALVERSAGAAEAGGARRLVILVSGGFDLEPAWLPDGLPAPPSHLRAAAERTARTAASYGWVVVPLLAPPEAGTLPGVRIGPVRLGRVPGLPPPEGGDDERAVPVGPGIGGYLEEDRDPEKAAAHLALAEAHLAAGEAEAAAAEAERALRHFSDDPRTAEPQARALVVLADAERALDRPQRARRALRQAVLRDPEALAGHPALRALPAAPAEALAVLAEAGGGSVVRGAGGLATAASGLDRRAVVTVQLTGLPDGAVHAASVRVRGEELDSPAWLRFGPAEALSVARARAHAGGPPDGELAVEAVLAPERDRLRITVGGLAAAPDGGAPAGAVAVRVVAALPAPEGEAEPEVVVLGTHEVRPDAAGVVALELTPPPGARAAGATVLVEDLLTGRWGSVPVAAPAGAPAAPP